MTTFFAGVERRTVDALVSGDYADPHHVLGAHRARADGAAGVVVRAYHPDAVGCDVVRDGEPPHAMDAQGRGLFAVLLAGALLPLRYRLRFTFADGAVWERDDPYRFLPTVGELDLHLFGKGDHRRLWEVLGAHPRTIDGVEGTSFAGLGSERAARERRRRFLQLGRPRIPDAVARSVGSLRAVRSRRARGKLLQVRDQDARRPPRLKTDPYAQAMEMPPHTASRVTSSATSGTTSSG
jgi:1,4-alpha-glucan branching enzyme